MRISLKSRNLSSSPIISLISYERRIKNSRLSINISQILVLSLILSSRIPGKGLLSENSIKTLLIRPNLIRSSIRKKNIKN
jgi:hypothetical protein